MKISKIEILVHLFFLILAIFFTLLAFPGKSVISGQVLGAAEAGNNANQVYSIRLDQPTIAKGYTVTAFDELKLSLVPGILSEATPVEIVQLNEPLPDPWKVDRVSRIYQFEFKNKEAYDEHKPFYIQFSYIEPTNYYKQVYFFDKNFSAWRPLPTRDFPEEHFVRSLIHLPFARIAVFSNPAVLTVGDASWYGYKGGEFAASPDFPKGSRLRVHNIENGKFVDVVINDFGPNRALHPSRVVDLDKVAFVHLAPLSKGVLDIYIEPLNIVPDNNGKTLGVDESGITENPQITLAAAIIQDERSGQVIWQKNASSTLPLASLTKMVAVKVFLDTQPSLDEVVFYSLKDEEYNYKHVNRWESAKLALKEGETLTIKDLVYTSLVGSTNNTIETLVRICGLERKEFIKTMNTLVLEWGASSTYFIEPTGLAPENVSSVKDYAIITKEVLKHPVIEKASAMPEYSFNTISENKNHKIKNTNYLISTNKFQISGSKTGYLDEAGYCLMTRVNAPSGHKIIVVTFGAENRETSFNETGALLRYGIKKAKEL